MCPNSTLSHVHSRKRMIHLPFERLTEEKQASNLILHNRESSDYQHFDISTPYLVVYETVDINSNTTIYMEFCEDGQFRQFNPYTDYMKIKRKLHSHDFYEITYVLSGRLTMYIEDECVSYETGECCVCNKNIHHVEVLDEDTELVFLLLKEEFLRELLSGGTLDDGTTESISGNRVFDRFFAENRQNPLYDAKVYADFCGSDESLQKSFLGLINAIAIELTSQHLGKSYMVRALLCRFLELMETAQAYDTQVHSARLSREEQVVYKISRAYRKSAHVLPRSEIEKLTGYCSDHVERIVKRHTGMTLTEYGHRFLLQKAASLLESSKKGVGEICEELGYANRSYFNRIFRQRYGMSPTDYRKQFK